MLRDRAQPSFDSRTGSLVSHKTVLSYEFVNILVLANASIKKTLLSLDGTTLTEYAILQRLLVLNRPVGLTEYYDFLLLRKSTISIAVARLESAGYLEKELDGGDLRKCRIAITEKGRSLAHDATEAIWEVLRKDFWKSFDVDYVNWGMEVDARVYQASGATPKEVREALRDGDLFVPSWVMAMRYLERLWTDVLRKSASLSLSEFRVLDLLEVKGKPLSSVEISNTLHLEASAVSRVTRALCGRGLVNMEQSKVDRRSFESCATEEGRALLVSARKGLREATDAHYSIITDQEREGLVAWHKQMFADFLL